MATKILDIVAMLRKAGFILRKGGKGSHRKYYHPGLNITITVSRHDGDDAPHYLIKQVKEAISNATDSGV